MKDFKMDPDRVYSRRLLASSMGLNDRAMRARVRDMRRAGIPVVAVKEGGYKLAETPQEWDQLIAMYIHRGLDELETAAMLKETYEAVISGQISVDEVAV